jgi:hypothetical protein
MVSVLTPANAQVGGPNQALKPRHNANNRHTSIVAYGREVFFGQGILEARPGTTHHGPPMQIIDCGRTEIDETTFNEYIASLQEMYTPDAYHLIEFNCNHFTADVVGFLTGAEIPSWISGEQYAGLRKLEER